MSRPAERPRRRTSPKADTRRARFAPNVEARRLGIVTCQCGKRTYLSRGDARAALRRLFPGRDGMQVYRCPWVDTDAYHFGHPKPGDR